MRKYTNQQLTSAEVIAELISLAKDVVAEAARGARFTPPLDEDQLAFFDAVATNESAVDVMGEGILADIARALVAVMQRDIRTDWTVRDDVRAKLRTSIKLLLVKHGCQPAGHSRDDARLADRPHDRPRFIINFPTKGHWRSSSKIGDIDRGLDDLVRVVQEHRIPIHVAMAALSEKGWTRDLARVG